jgi:hypothetical protein
MMRIILVFLFLFISFSIFAQSGGAIRPHVILWRCDEKVGCTATPQLDSVKITAYIPGTTDTLRGVTDSLGKFCFKPIPGGIYTIRAELNGFISREYKGVIVSENKTTYLCIEMTPVKEIITTTEKKNRKKKTGR